MRFENLRIKFGPFIRTVRLLHIWADEKYAVPSSIRPWTTWTVPRTMPDERYRLKKPYMWKGSYSVTLVLRYSVTFVLCYSVTFVLRYSVMFVLRYSVTLHVCTNLNIRSLSKMSNIVANQSYYLVTQSHLSNMWSNVTTDLGHEHTFTLGVSAKLLICNGNRVDAY